MSLLQFLLSFLCLPFFPSFSFEIHGIQTLSHQSNKGSQYADCAPAPKVFQNQWEHRANGINFNNMTKTNTETNSNSTNFQSYASGQDKTDQSEMTSIPRSEKE